PVFQQYGADFGKGKLEQLQWVDKYLGEESSVMLDLIIRNPPVEISLQYNSYAWESIGRFVLQVGEAAPRTASAAEEEDDEVRDTLQAAFPERSVVLLLPSFLSSPRAHLIHRTRRRRRRRPRQPPRAKRQRSAPRSRTPASCAATAPPSPSTHQ